MSAFGANLGLKEADMEKMTRAFAGVQQVAISMRGNQILILVTGRSPEASLPALDQGWKAALPLRKSIWRSSG